MGRKIGTRLRLTYSLTAADRSTKLFERMSDVCRSMNAFGTDQDNYVS